MSVLDSNLPKYGYDTVVAVTQKALNNIIKLYYSKNASAFTEQVCYFTKENLNNSGAIVPAPIDKASLLAKTNNVDPFTVPAWNGVGNMPANVSNVVNSDFYFAFQFTPGDPGGINNFTYLTLRPEDQLANYYLLCKSIQFVFWNPDTKAWVNITQSRMNEFNINAIVSLQNILSNAGLPPDVQAEVNNLGDTDVNIQQLILDFDSAVISPTTALPGLDPGSSVFDPLMLTFASSYFNAYAAVEVPRLNYTIIPKNTSSLTPTAMEFYVAALLDDNGNPVTTITDDAQADLSTINYFFSVNGDTLPAPTQLGWNWLVDNGSTISPLTPGTDPNADVNKYNGIVSISRDAFAKYLDKQLNSYVMQNWFVPIVSAVHKDYGNKDDADLFMVNTEIITSIPDGFQPYNGDNLLSIPDKLVHWTNNQSVSAQGVVDPSNNMKVNSYFDISLSVYKGQATLSQAFRIEVYETYNGSSDYGGTPIEIQSSDVFNLAIDDQGNLMFEKVPAQSYYVSRPETITLDSNENDWLQNWLNAVTAKCFEELPVTMPQQFVFPGGDAFTFQRPMFSNTSDLVCFVTYKAEA